MREESCDVTFKKYSWINKVSHLFSCANCITYRCLYGDQNPLTFRERRRKERAIVEEEDKGTPGHVLRPRAPGCTEPGGSQ